MKPRSPLQEALIRSGRILKGAALAAGLLRTAVICLAIWLALFVLDNALRFPPGLRLPLALSGAAVSVYLLASRALRPALRKTLPQRTARNLEQRFRVPDNLLINACQLESLAALPGEQAFVARTLQASGNRLRGISPAALWDWTRLRRWAAAAAGCLLLWCVYALSAPRQAGNALARYIRPLEDIPPAGFVRLTVNPAEDLSVFEGEDLTVQAVVRSTRADAGAPETAPFLVWNEGLRLPTSGETAGNRTEMLPAARGGAVFQYTFRDVRRPFAFRVFAANTYARGIRVRVHPLPRIRTSQFRVDPPPYTGLPPTEQPGPPAALNVLPGSRLRVDIELTRPVKPLSWTQADAVRPFIAANGAWRLETLVEKGGTYSVQGTDPLRGRSMTLAEGNLGLQPDREPSVRFLTDNPNRYVSPGASLRLNVEASDDYGLRALRIVCRPADQPQSSASDSLRVLKHWQFPGPPGPAGPVVEQAVLHVDPGTFVPGSAHTLYAEAFDFAPAEHVGRSQPIVLRVRSVEQLELAPGDELAGAFQHLERTAAEQRQANALTANCRVHLPEIVAGERIAEHRKAMTERQDRARGHGQAALQAFAAAADGSRYVTRLQTVVRDEMAWVLASLETLADADLETLNRRLETITRRQDFILRELLALLGRIRDDRTAPPGESVAAAASTTPALTAEDAGRLLADDLKTFARVQKRIIRRSQSLLDLGPDDLTEAEEEILGQLAREEAEWAAFFEERLTDFSKLPLHDFADGSIAEEFNEIVQEIRLAAQSLYEKNIEIAVPQEQAGLESAEELIHNLERWLPDVPDHIKWSMEEPPVPFNIPLAELPAELEDIIGDLLDSMESMTDEVEDVSSSWIDSLDKGAGWDAVDGPISSMSAKGVTGNLLPNEHEVGGRAGEGRSGRSHGQIVEATAEGKGGRETPTRVSPSPFEQGSIEDSARGSAGGATGGGKLSGFTGEGLRGPAPAPRLQQMARLAGQQAQIRQQAEVLALRLRQHRLPTGDLENAIVAMRRLEDDALRGHGIGVRRAFSHAVDALGESRRAVRGSSGLHREVSGLPEWQREDILTGLREGTPSGYETVTAAYFRALARQPGGFDP